MGVEKAYTFRERLLTVHEKNVRDFSVVAVDDEFCLADEVLIGIGEDASEVVKFAAEDFVDFLAVSMNIKASISDDVKADISLKIANETAELREADGYKGFFINVSDGIEIYGADERGVAAALYYIEDLMCMKKAPILARGEIRKKPMLSPRMVHSGYALDDYPDEYLTRIAHEGRDAILIFAWDINKTHLGHLDFNDLIARAKVRGIDVYAYSFFIGGPHPDEEGAYEYYDNTYGRLFRECPDLRGVTFVGEVVEFQSKDPHVSKFRCRDTVTDDLPDGKPWPGWYPCEDWPKWLSLVEKVIHNAKPSADIVMWSYNWGYQPEDARVRLIENMPENVTLQATFEMFDNRKTEDVVTAVSDYSLSYVGPGPYFVSEAKAAARRGIKFYAQTQAAGVTWDFGVIPYLPMPQQWLARFEKMREANRDWGFCGGMENHHHGFYPSIISKFSHHAFLEPLEPLDELLSKLLAAEYGAENLEKVSLAFELWSKAISHYTPSEGDFSGAARIGPAYPFCLFYQAKPPRDESAFFGIDIFLTEYATGMEHSVFISAPPRENFLSMRIRPELRSLKTMHSLMKQGIEVFESIENKNEKLLSVINLGKFMTCSVLTNIHAKEWYILKRKLYAEEERETLLKIVSDMEKLLLDEIENAREALPLVDFDSRLGWEPTMNYLGDREHIEWKIRQVKYVLEKEMVKLRKSIELEM